MNLTELLIPTYTNMLSALSHWLDTAQEHASEPEALLKQRLAPDMFPLAAQVRFCCMQAYEAVARLRGEALPDIWNVLAQEGRDAGDRAGDLANAKARLAEALAFLSKVSPNALDAGEDRPIALELPNGMTFDMNGAQYARDWALPQFYFHLITAYGVLRSAGVPLGKADYVRHAFAYLRPDAPPPA